MPSQTRRSSRLRSSAAKKIQKRFRSKQTRKQVTKLKATRKIQSKVRGKQTRKVINREKNTSTTVHDCPICFEPLTTDVRIALPCGHRFHEDCIRRSLISTHGKCPKCRTDVTNIRYPSIQQIQAQAQAQVEALNPRQQIEQLLTRRNELEIIRQRIGQQTAYLHEVSEIPNIPLNEALHEQHIARQIVDDIRTLFYETSNIYQNYDSYNINDHILRENLTNMYLYSSQLLTRAQENRNYITRIVDELGDNEIPDLV